MRANDLTMRDGTDICILSTKEGARGEICDLEHQLRPAAHVSKNAYCAVITTQRRRPEGATWSPLNGLTEAVCSRASALCTSRTDAVISLQHRTAKFRRASSDPTRDALCCEAVLMWMATNAKTTAWLWVLP
jgi:hypothetical protein